MRKILIIATALLFIGGTVDAQLVLMAKKAIPLIKKRTLAVVITENDERKEKEFKKDTAALAQYRQSVVDFNAMLKEVVLNEWKYSKDIIFVTENEAKKLKSDRSENHCILEVQVRSNYRLGDFSQTGSAGKSVSPTPPRVPTIIRLPDDDTALALLFADSPRREIIVSYFPAMSTWKPAILFMIQNLQNQLRDAETNGITSTSKWKLEVSKRTALLKNKTILVFDPFVSYALQRDMKAGKVSGYYKGKVAIVEPAEAQQIITAKDGNYAYALVVPSGSSLDGIPMLNYYVVDAKDGSILYFNGKKVWGAIGEFHPYYLKQINKKIKR